MEDIKDQILSTPLLRVLGFLLEHSDLALSDSEITAQIAGVKRAAVHQALTRLGNMGVVHRTLRGRKCYNALDAGVVWLAPLKIALNLLSLDPLVQELCPHASSIVLFGSRAEGSDRHDSDYDLAIVASDPVIVQKIADASPLAERLQLIVKSPEQMLGFEAQEPVLAARIRKGIRLWER